MVWAQLRAIDLVLVVLIILTDTAQVCTSPTGRHLLEANLDINHDRSGKYDSDVIEYLSKYQYLGKNSPDASQRIITSDSYTDALKKFQKMAGIPQSGVMDEATQTMVNMPRCGNPDIVSPADGSNRTRRYVLHGSLVEVQDIKYYIRNPTPDLSEHTVRREIQAAFDMWAEHTPLTFTRVDNSREAHILILFASRSHGDPYDFDGPGKTLAHAFFPSSGSDAHFDEDENWTSKSFSGVNLFQSAAHEFGHSLGLTHSDIKYAIMAPFSRRYTRNFRLHADDIAGIQYLYGSKTTTPVTKRPTSTPPSSSQSLTTTQDPQSNIINYCEDPRMDAITYISYFNLNVGFRNDTIYFFGPSGLLVEPRLIVTHLPGIPSNLDDAVFTSQNNTYMFKGQHVWVMHSRFIRGPYHRNLIFPGLALLNYVNNDTVFDAVFMWGSRKNSIYFCAGSKYFRYDIDTHSVGARYPLRTSLWGGIKAPIQTAFRDPNQNRNFFFNNDDFYRLHRRSFKWDTGYPRSVSKFWFGCTSNRLSADEFLLGAADNLPLGSTDELPVEIGNLQESHHGIVNNTLPDIIGVAEFQDAPDLDDDFSLSVDKTDLQDKYGDAENLVNSATIYSTISMSAIIVPMLLVSYYA